MPNYFLSYGTRVNEYQVWRDGFLKCRHREPRGVLEYMQLEKKLNVDVELIGVGGLEDLAKRIMERLREPKATAETTDKILEV